MFLSWHAFKYARIYTSTFSFSLRNLGQHCPPPLLALVWQVVCNQAVGWGNTKDTATCLTSIRLSLRSFWRVCYAPNKHSKLPIGSGWCNVKGWANENPPFLYWGFEVVSCSFDRVEFVMALYKVAGWMLICPHCLSFCQNYLEWIFLSLHHQECLQQSQTHLATFHRRQLPELLCELCLLLSERLSCVLSTLIRDPYEIQLYRILNMEALS